MDSNDKSNRPTAEPTPALDDIETAAAKLGIDPDALRARCRRAAQRRGDAIVAHLGGGIVGFKFGSSWRIRFPRVWSTADDPHLAFEGKDGPR